MSLPNELLRQSFSYVIPIDRWGTLDDGTRRDFFSLRSVCRTFRAVIDGLDFWCDPQFEYADLIRYQDDVSQQEREASQVEFLNILFRNSLLVECIGRRGKWRFTTLTGLNAIREYIPSFPSNTTAVTFEGAISSNRDNGWNGVTVPVGIRALADCTQLTFLKIWGLGSDDNENIDLDLITTSCPNLQHLILRDLLRYTGTLAHMQHLADLQVGFSQYRLREEVRDDRILPLQYGRRTLSKLWLLYEECFLPSLGILGLADPFPNLTSLSLHPFTNDLCDYISTASIRLVQFRTTVTEADNMPILSNITNMFSAPSLANLKELRIAFQYQEEQRPEYERIFHSICARLLHLEGMVLGISFDTAWFAQLTNLQKLTDMVWYIPADDCRDTLHGMMPELPDLRNSDPESGLDSLRTSLVNHFQYNKFDQLKVLPHTYINLMVLTRDGYRNLCDMNAAPSIYAEGGDI
jgi:hypothetical protein